MLDWTKYTWSPLTAELGGRVPYGGCGCGHGITIIFMFPIIQQYAHVHCASIQFRTAGQQDSTRTLTAALRNICRILVRGVNAPLPPEVKKILKIGLRNGAF